MMSKQTKQTKVSYNKEKSLISFTSINVDMFSNFFFFIVHMGREDVKDPGHGFKSIRGSWRDHFGGISGVLDTFRGL